MKMTFELILVAALSLCWFPAAPAQSTASKLSASDPASGRNPARGHKKQHGLPFVAQVRTLGTGNHMRVVIEVEDEVHYRAGRISNPDRIYLDLYKAQLDPTLGGKTLEVQTGLLEKIRVGQNQPGAVRVVLDLNRVEKYLISSVPDSNHLAVDLYGSLPLTAKAVSATPPEAEKSGPKYEMAATVLSQGPAATPANPGTAMTESLRSNAAQAGVTLSGSIEDQSGAVIPGAKLILTNRATGQARVTTSDAEGEFSFSALIPEEYSLRGEIEGFRSAELHLRVQDKPLPGVRLVLYVGGREEEVKVTASGSRPDAENNADAVYVNSEMIDALPSQGQDIVPVLSNFLSPAAQGPDGPSILVDGVEVDGFSLPTAAVRRTDINKNPYSAEFRRPGSSRVEIVTQNGSRGHFDGSFAAFVRNDALDARNAFAKEKPSQDRRLFETSLGGPLPLKHARFFLSGSRLMNQESAIVNATTLAGPLVQNVPTSQTTTNLFGRIDLRPNDSNTVTLLYSFHDDSESNRGVGGLRLPEQGTSANDRRQKFQAYDTTVFSPHFINTVRFGFERRNKRRGIRAFAPAIEVRGAFTGGPNQSARSLEQTSFVFEDIAGYDRGRHTLRFGGSFRPRFFTFSDATNFGGTFTFSGLPSLQAANPTLFQIIQGQPNGSFSLPEANGFVQDQIRLDSHTTLLLGLRYDWQAKVGHPYNFAPRLALAFAPGDQKTVLRAGAGIFYDRLPGEAVELSLLLDGIRAREFIVEQPPFPDVSIGAALPSVWGLARDTRSPYLFQGSLSVERRLWGSTRATIEYQYLRGVHVYRARDVNAPLEAGAARPDPGFFLVRQIESSASMRSNALIATFQGRLGKALKIKAQYALSRTEDDTEGPFDLPASSRDLRPEWGLSAFDRRHRFTLAGFLNLPGGFRLGELFTLGSAAPFNITTGGDDNVDGVANDRPPGVTRNTGRGPGLAQLDIRFGKVFSFPASASRKAEQTRGFRRLELFVDVFNVLNQTNFTSVIGNLSSPNFGRPNAALQARVIQLSLRYKFREF